MSRTGKCLSLSIGNPSRWHNRFHGTIDSTTLWPFFITWVFLRGVFFKTPRKNTPDFKVYGLLFSHFITWVKKVRGVFKLLARNLNFEYLLVYYHVIQLPPEAIIHWLTFLLLTSANISTSWCFENSTDPIFQRYKVSFFGIRGVFFFKTPRIRGNTHVIKNGLRCLVVKKWATRNEPPPIVTLQGGSHDAGLQL